MMDLELIGLVALLKRVNKLVKINKSILKHGIKLILGKIRNNSLNKESKLILLEIFILKKI